MAEDIGNVEVDVLPDVNAAVWKKDINAALKKVGPITVKVLPDVSRSAITAFKKELEAKLNANPVKVLVKPELSKAALRKSVADLNAFYREKKNAPTVYVTPGFRITDVRKSIKDLNAKLKAAGQPTIYIDVKTKESLAATEAQIAAMNKRTDVLREQNEQRALNREARNEALRHRQVMFNLRLEQRERERLSAMANAAINSAGLGRYESATLMMLRRLGKAWAVYGAVASTAVASIGTAAIVSFAQLEESANQASQVFTNNISGIAQKTGDEFVRLNRGIRSRVVEGAGIVARSTAFDLEQAAGSMRALAAAGVDLEVALGNTDQKIKGLGLTVAQFAQAAGIEDLELATDKLIAIQQQAAAAPAFTSVYKTQAEQVQRVADLVILASNKSLGNAQQLSEALANRVTGQLASMNRPLEEAVTLTSVLSQSGLLGRPGGEQAAIIMRDLAIKASKFREEFEKLGVEVFDANGNLRSGTAILDELSTSLGKMSDQERVAALAAAGITLRTQGVFSRLIATSTAIRREQGKSLVDLQKELQRDAAGAVARQAEARLDTLTQQFAAFVEGAKVGLATLGGPAARRVTDFLKELNGELTTGASSPFFDSLEKSLGSLSQRMDAFIAKTIALLKSDEFTSFVKDLSESFILASRSVITFFQGIAYGMTGIRSGGGNSLEAFGETIRSISERLPAAGLAVGEFFGRVIRFIRENSGVLVPLAKSWLALGVGLRVVRIALAPLIKLFAVGRVIWANLPKIIAYISEAFRLLGVTARLTVRFLGIFSAAITVVSGVIVGVVREMRNAEGGGRGFIKMWELLKRVLGPVIDLLELTFKILFRIGEFVGKVLVKTLGTVFGWLADQITKSIDLIAGVFSKLGSIPGMGKIREWANDARDAVADFANGTDGNATKVEKNSRRIVKAVQDIDVAVSKPGVGKARDALAGAVLSRSGNVQKAAEELRAELARTGQAEAEQFNRRAVRLAGLERKYKSIEKILNTRISGGIWSAITGQDVDARENQVTQGLIDGQQKLSQAVERRILAQARSLQILGQTGKFSKDEVEASLRQLNDALSRYGSGISVPVTVNKASLVETERRIAEASRPRTVEMTIVERVKSIGGGIFDAVKGVFLQKQRTELQQVIAEAQRQTQALSVALAALKTAMRRPAVEAVNGMVAVIRDIPRQLGNAAAVVLPRIVAIARSIAAGLITGSRQMHEQVSAAGVALGQAYMAGLKAGLQSGFNTLIVPLLKQFTAEIPKLKGPIAYDAQLLQPAGTAIMGGFARGLESGFNDVRGWLRGVAPQIEESVPDSLMVQRTGKFLVDWIRSGKTLKPDDAFKDLVPAMPVGIGDFPLDPSLGFLHRTASLADTGRMANTLAKMFGLRVSSMYRPGAITSSGNPSDHGKGWAADLAGSATASDRLVAAIRNLYPAIIKQLIWRNKDVNRGFFVPDHMDHVHLAFQPASNFALNSGRIGQGAVTPGGGGSSDVMQAIFRAAMANRVPVSLVKAVAKAESGFNPRAVSPAGARGLMQLMPATGRGLGVTDFFNPQQNAMGGARYLRNLLDMFKSVQLAVAAYNAGPFAVRRYGGIPPFSETRAYVQKVMAYLRMFGGAGDALRFGGFRANGGPVKSGTAYMVGERGPEMFVPSRSGNVVSHADLMALLELLKSQRSGRQMTYSSTVNVQSMLQDPSAVAGLIDSHNRLAISRIL